MRRDEERDIHQQQQPEPVRGPASYFPSIERTYGRPIEEWLELILASPLERHMELVSWLKTDFGLGHGHANALVHAALPLRGR